MGTVRCLLFDSKATNDKGYPLREEQLLIPLVNNERAALGS